MLCAFCGRADPRKRTSIGEHAEPSVPGTHAPAKGSVLNYRPDIDGLRSVAVMLVILDHLNLRWFSGGFIGVDVFFVISGYLITGDIARRLGSGTFSVAGFYERRFRRIIPALTVMLAAVSLLAWVVLLPGELQNFAYSLIAAACCYSNLFFAASQEGYFTASYSNLLLHTWSLGVEEQFYLVIPLCMMLAAKWRRSIKPFLAIVAALSFLTASASAVRHTGQPFYSPFARTWELLAGSMLALGMMPRLRGKFLRGTLAVLSILAIFAFTAFYVPAMPFPGAAALPACLGAVLMIATGDGEGTVVSRVLALRPVVFVGQISYSLYLWHWPVIVAVRMRLLPHVADRTIAGYIAVMVLSFSLAVLSWRFVELPFRFGRLKRISRREVFTLAAASVLAMAGVGFGFSRSQGWPARFSARELQVASAATLSQEIRNPCFLEGGFDAFDKAKCLYSVPGKTNVLLLGDSHAAALWPGLRTVFPEANLMQATAATCHPNLQPYRSSACSQMRKFLFEEYFPTHHPDVVVLTERWGLERDDPLDLVPVVKRLQVMGSRVVVVGPVPEYTMPLPVLLALGMKLQREDYSAANRTAMAEDLDPVLRQSLAGIPHVQYVSVVQAFCHDRQCLEYADDAQTMPVLTDVDHLTPAASVRFFQELRDSGVLRF